MSDRISVARPPAQPRSRAAVSRAGALPWLAGVCAAFVLVQLALAVPGTGLAWDETVYTSQVSGRVPAAFFSAPRARGITFLAAPVAQVTTSVLVLRVWMALLSGLGLLAALWVWRTLVPPRVLATAGGLFATLWITMFYGPQVMPNLWSAYGALAAVGCFVRAARDRGDRWALAGVVTGVAVTGLMRPPDAVWLVVPPAAAALWVRRWRRPALFAVLGAGLLLGCAEWVIEAYADYGGLAERLRLAGRIQGGIGRHFAVDDQIRALDGRSLCRPCDVPWRHKATAGWWFALPFLTAGGIAATARARSRAVAVLPPLVACGLAFPYLFTIDYAAPRFLLPAYALLALPVAECLWWLTGTVPGAVGGAAPGSVRGHPRPVVTALVAAALVGHLGVQYAVLARAVHNNRVMRRSYDAVAAALHRAGVRPPCVLSGSAAVPLAFYAGCASRDTGGPDASVTPAALVTRARSEPVAVVVAPGGTPPGYARSWASVPLPGAPQLTGYRAYVAPPARPPGRPERHEGAPPLRGAPPRLTAAR